MDDEIYKNLKFQTSKLYSLCNKLWPKEFLEVYQADPTDFREWLNTKTGLTYDHRAKRHESIAGWLAVIEKLAR